MVKNCKYGPTNELIAVFMGGQLDNVPMFGRVYRFDARFGNRVEKVDNLQYDSDWNWFMPVLQECRDKKMEHVSLEAIYDELMGMIGMFYIPFIYPILIEFIEMYNILETNEKGKNDKAVI